MYKCTFIDLLNHENEERIIGNFYEIVEAVNSLFKKVLVGLEKEKNFKDIFSPEDFMHFLGNFFLQENANVISVRIDPIFESIQSREILGDCFFLSISLSGRSQQLAIFTIECSRQDFQDLTQIIKEQRALRLEREIEKMTSPWSLKLD